MKVQENLIQQAFKAQKKAYAPYSKFQVGAAIMTISGDIYLGCNVENLSYGLTICAERNAITNAIVDGHTQFQIIAIVANSTEPIAPCGACRQVMAEFGNFEIICATPNGKLFHTTTHEALPQTNQGLLENITSKIKS